MIRVLGLVALLAMPATGQGLLGEDLDRANQRYVPTATARSVEVDKLVAKAAEQLRQGATPQAVQLLDQAMVHAEKNGAKGRALELSLTAAEAQRVAGEALDAAQRFRVAALGAANDPRAARAHQTACETLRSVAKAPIDQLDAWLAEHIATWPNSTYTPDANWSRVELLAKRGHWEELAQRIHNVSPDSPHYARAQQLLVKSYAQQLQQRQVGEPRAELERIILGSPPAWPADWKPSQRDAAMALARDAIRRGRNGAQDARLLLRQAVRGRPAVDLAWRRQAVSLLIVGCLLEQDIQAATDWLITIYQSTPTKRDKLLRAMIDRLSAGAAPLEVADRLHAALASLGRPTPTPTPASAEALSDVGREADALAAYAQLAKERPDDRDVQVAYAQLLIGSESPQDRESGLSRWHAIESRSTPHSEEWFEARLGRLRALVALGRVEEAHKLVRLTRLLAPAIARSEHNTEFEQIANSLE